MTDLSLHIEYLLQHHDCVIIPGLGAFVAVYTPALFDAERDIIAPPQRGVQFNPAISSDDGLLASSYARRYSLNYTAARERLMRDVDMMRRRLEEGLSLRIGNIGTLATGDEQRILFTPRMKADMLASALGCHVIGLSPVRTAAEDHEADSTGEIAADNGMRAASAADSRKIAAGASDKADRMPVPATVPTIFGRRRISDRNIYVAINRQFAGAAAIALVVVALASAFLIPPYAHRRHVEASIVPVEKILRLHSFGQDDNNTASHAAQVRTHKKSAPVAAKPLPAAADLYGTVSGTVSGDSDRDGYHLIIATFHSEQDAADYIASAPEDVAAVLKVVTKGRTSRVSLASSSRRESLVSELNRVQDRFPGAWIWAEK